LRHEPRGGRPALAGKRDSIDLEPSTVVVSPSVSLVRRDGSMTSASSLGAVKA
jgi:hypothetical protein